MSENSVQVASFNVDVTPDIGDPIEYGTVQSISNRLSCRGIIILGDGLPIVLASVDWLGNFNGGYDSWRLALAEAANTSPDRVAIHAVHQHEAPGFDTDAMGILFSRNITNMAVDGSFARDAISRTANAVEESRNSLEKVTHVGFGTAKVTKVASNRQLLGTGGKIIHSRSIPDTDSTGRQLPEGLIDPVVRIVSFWDGNIPKAALSYYAVHPISGWGDRSVSSDFVGIARNLFEKDIETPVIHFTGAAGNLLASKYYDNTEEARSKLTDRLRTGLVNAWESTVRKPLSTENIEWNVRHISLPPSDHLERKPLVRALASGCDQKYTNIHKRDLPKLPKLFALKIGKEIPWFDSIDTPHTLYTSFQAHRVYSHTTQIARDLAWLHRCERGNTIPLTCLSVGTTRIINAPGELFVEYQLAFDEMRPDLDVVVAAYGDSGPFYIPTRDAYHRGGYGVGVESRVSPEAEDVLVSAVGDLLEVPDSKDITTPSEITRDRKPRIDLSDYT